MKKVGFTLAEVLITLGIIGVVAAMTIPTLMTNIKAAKLKSQFMKAHSTVLQAYRLMLSDDVSIDTSDYTDSKTFYKTFMRYFQGVTDCGASINSTTRKYLPCYNLSQSNGDGYKSLDKGSKVSKDWFDDGQIALQNGSLVLIENFDGKLWISIDVNGYNNKPNVWGADLFTFEVLDGEITAMGSTKSTHKNTDALCNKNRPSTLNGLTCTKKAIDDPDYFKKAVKDLKL